MANKGPYYHEGRYRMRITDQGFAETEKKGTPYFFLRGTPLTQFVEGNEYEVKPYEREIVMYLTDKAVDYAVDKLRSLGWEGSSFKELDPASPNAVTWVGQIIDVECAHETTDSGTWERWNLPYVATDKPPKPKGDPKVASKLDAMFGKLLKGDKAAAKPSKPAPAKKPKAVGATAAKDDGDIPF